LFADPAQLLRPPEISTNNPPSVPTMRWSPDEGLTLRGLKILDSSI